MKFTEDYYARLAREKGYPARSVFKLMEIQEKYPVFRRGDKVLDIGSAPGSWSMYALEAVGASGMVVGVDLSDMSMGRNQNRALNFIFIKGDIGFGPIRAAIEAQGPFTLIMSDAAPSTTGDRLVDTSRSYELVAQVLDYAEKMLQKDGRMIAKIFQGGDEKELEQRMKGLFASVKIFKPKASKKASMETYFIGLGRKQA